MHYYEHHIGDYAEATAHLSWLEDAAYSRLLRKYYASEQPLPADLKAVQRLVGARSKDEREAVESVLREFFVLQDDGWHQHRCDEEIKRTNSKRTKAKRSAETRWSAMRTHSETDANALPTDSERSAKAMLSNHQAPITKHQREPDAEPRQPSAPDPSGPADAPFALSLDFEIPGGWIADARSRRPDVNPEVWQGSAQRFVEFHAGLSHARRLSGWHEEWRKWAAKERAGGPVERDNGRRFTIDGQTYLVLPNPTGDQDREHVRMAQSLGITTAGKSRQELEHKLLGKLRQLTGAQAA